MEYSLYAYRSCQAHSFTDYNIYDLVQEASRLNALDGITGVLFVDGEHFIQIVEGGAEAISSLKLRLARDDRHKDIETLLETSSNSKLFLGWDMKLLEKDSPSKSQAVAALIYPRLLPDTIARILDGDPVHPAS